MQTLLLNQNVVQNVASWDIYRRGDPWFPLNFSHNLIFMNLSEFPRPSLKDTSVSLLVQNNSELVVYYLCPAHCDLWLIA